MLNIEASYASPTVPKIRVQLSDDVWAMIFPTSQDSAHARGAHLEGASPGRLGPSHEGKHGMHSRSLVVLATTHDNIQTFHNLVGPILYSETVVDNLEKFIYGLKDHHPTDRLSRYSKRDLLGCVTGLHLTYTIGLGISNPKWNVEKRIHEEVRLIERAQALLAGLQDKNVFPRLEKFSLGREGSEWMGYDQPLHNDVRATDTEENRADQTHSRFRFMGLLTLPIDATTPVAVHSQYVNQD